MIKLLPYQENFILSLLLLFLSFSSPPLTLISFHVFLVFFFTSRHLCYSHKFYVASWWWLHSYSLPFDDVTDNLSDTKKMVKSRAYEEGEKKSCVMKNSIGFVVLVVILPFVCFFFLSTILTTNSNSTGFIWIFSIASVSDHKNKLRSGIHISHYPFELYIRVILIPRKKRKSRKQGLCIVYM